jgi:pantothenate kinase
MDIGGSLAKVVVFEPNKDSSDLVQRVADRMKSGKHPGYEASLAFEADDGLYSFLKFETKWMPHFLDVLKVLQFPPVAVSATGGGAFKVRAGRTSLSQQLSQATISLQFAAAFSRSIGATIMPCDEMSSLVRGFRFCFEVR